MILTRYKHGAGVLPPLSKQKGDYGSIIEGSAIWSRFGKAVKIEQGLQGRASAAKQTAIMGQA